MGTSRWLIVVQSGQYEFYEALRQSIREDGPVMVIYERRSRERRRGGQAARADRRRSERRRQRPSGWLYDCEILRVGPGDDAAPAPRKERDAVREVATRPCPECGAVLEFEMPRFPQPPARLEIQMLHTGDRGASVQHHVEIQAFSATGRPLLLQRNQALRRASP